MSQPQKPDPSDASRRKQLHELAQKPQTSLVHELFLLVAENKKWWMVPIFVVLGLVGLLALLGSTGAAPFIYTLF